jgi:hypothetical protein
MVLPLRGVSCQWSVVRCTNRLIRLRGVRCKLSAARGQLSVVRCPLHKSTDSTARRQLSVLRAFRRVPSSVGVRACPRGRHLAEASGSASEIKTCPKPQIGPKDARSGGAGESAMDRTCGRPQRSGCLRVGCLWRLHAAGRSRAGVDREPLPANVPGCDQGRSCAAAHRRHQKPDVRYPFHHLQSDGCWKALGEDGSASPDRRLTRCAAYNPEFEACLNDSSFRDDARRVLIGVSWADDQTASNPALNPDLAHLDWHRKKKFLGAG